MRLNQDEAAGGALSRQPRDCNSFLRVQQLSAQSLSAQSHQSQACLRVRLVYRFIKL